MMVEVLQSPSYLVQGFWVEFDRLLTLHEKNGCRYKSKCAPCSACATILSSVLNLFLLDSQKVDIKILGRIFNDFTITRFPRPDLILNIKVGGVEQRMNVNELYVYLKEEYPAPPVNWAESQKRYLMKYRNMLSDPHYASFDYGDDE
jgi:hypothetical protein